MLRQHRWKQMATTNEPVCAAAASTEIGPQWGEKAEAEKPEGRLIPEIHCRPLPLHVLAFPNHLESLHSSCGLPYMYIRRLGPFWYKEGVRALIKVFVEVCGCYSVTSPCSLHLLLMIFVSSSFCSVYDGASTNKIGLTLI